MFFLAFCRKRSSSRLPKGAAPEIMDLTELKSSDLTEGWPARKRTKFVLLFFIVLFLENYSPIGGATKRILGLALLKVSKYKSGVNLGIAIIRHPCVSKKRHVELSPYI